MDLSQLLSLPVIFFGLFIYFATLAIRRTVSSKWPDMEQNHYWRGVALPVIPSLIGVGMVYALTKNGVFTYPLPEIAMQSKVIFGATTGALSGTIYQVFKAMMLKTFGVDMDRKSVPPEAAKTIPVPPPSPDDTPKP